MPDLVITPALTPINHRKGRSGHRPLAIVDHIMEGTMAGTFAWFQNPAAKVSAHYGISRTGAVVQYVADEDTAWHAGRVLRPTAEIIKAHPGVNPNLITIGIEHEGFAKDQPTEAQIQASAELHALLSKRHAIPLTRRHVIGHREVFAGKPDCPGRIPLDTILARAQGLDGRPEPGTRVWSDFFGEHLIVTDYRSDTDWSFLRESHFRALGTRATTPFSQMPTPTTRS